MNYNFSTSKPIYFKKRSIYSLKKKLGNIIRDAKHQNLDDVLEKPRNLMRTCNKKERMFKTGEHSAIKKEKIFTPTSVNHKIEINYLRVSQNDSPSFEVSEINWEKPKEVCKNYAEEISSKFQITCERCGEELKKNTASKGK